MIAISHPTGNQNLRNAMAAFHNAGKLAQFYTTLAWDSSSRLAAIAPISLSEQLKRREYAGTPNELINQQPFRESARLLANKLNLRFLTTHETGIFSVDSVYRSLDRHVATQIHNLTELTDIYCYEDGALETFRAASQRHIRKIYELPIGYWQAAQQIMREEAELVPDWSETILSIRDSASKLARKDEELALADNIIVASRFTAKTLKLSPFQQNKIAVIPYGGPPPIARANLKKQSTAPLKVIFVGGLSQRKGLSYLLGATEVLKDKISLTLIGSRIGHCKVRDKALENHRYISSLTHSLVLEEMDRHDVLVFPSLFEGFGLVLLEAMSRGLPVIATPNTAAPDIIDNGEEGFIVPIRDSEAIANRLEALANDPELLNRMKINALEKSRQFSWLSYQKQLLKNVYQ